jgi:hypothetical protein
MKAREQDADIARSFHPRAGALTTFGKLGEAYAIGYTKDSHKKREFAERGLKTLSRAR